MYLAHLSLIDQIAIGIQNFAFTSVRDFIVNPDNLDKIPTFQGYVIQERKLFVEAAIWGRSRMKNTCSLYVQVHKK